ncbi:MAG: hypothetical protein KIT48_12005 [Pseudolabrys sp.]|nr:hypothetical protein [Pseudolabrys sp.]
MSSAPEFPVRMKQALRRPLFTADEAVANIPASVDPTPAANIAATLNRVFDEALTWADHDDRIPSPTALKRFYGNVATAAERLRELLGSDAIRWLQRDDLTSRYYGGERAVELQKMVDQATVSALMSQPEGYVLALQAKPEISLASLREEVVGDTIGGIPAALRTIQTLADFWSSIEVVAPAQARFGRAFQREVYRGLAQLHLDRFGELQLGRRDDLPGDSSGASDQWVNHVAHHALRAVDQSGVDLFDEDFLTRRAFDDVKKAFLDFKVKTAFAHGERLSGLAVDIRTDFMRECWPRTSHWLTDDI